MKKVLFLAGSLREKSYNKMLAREAADMASTHSEVDAQFIDLKDFDMPIYNGDIESSTGLPENAKKLKKLFAQSSGIFIASPEYNSSFSAALKNAIDWISRPHEENETPLIAFKGKTALLAAASPGDFGGLRGLVPLRLLLSNISVNVMGDQLAIPSCMKIFDENGKITDEKTRTMLKGLTDDFIQHCA